MADWINQLKKKHGEILTVIVSGVLIFLIDTVFYVSGGLASELKAEKPDSSKVAEGVSDPNDKVIYLPVDSNILQIAKEQLRGDFYKEAMECFRREMDNYKWVINIALVSCGIIVAIWGIAINAITKRSAEESKTASKESAKERGINELLTEAGIFYQGGYYKEAAEIYEKVRDEYRLDNRQFYNMWGSSLLNWAGTIEEEDKQKQLANESIKKYLEAEKFTKGIAAYNIACCYAILKDSEKCKEWLKTAKQTGRLLSWERASTDRDLKSYARESWFMQIWGQ